jgi:hypothetical protein
MLDSAVYAVAYQYIFSSAVLVKISFILTWFCTTHEDTSAVTNKGSARGVVGNPMSI